MDEEIHELPAEISLCVLRHLSGLDLLAACIASPAWAELTRVEKLWRRACEHRWPEVFTEPDGSLPAAASVVPPLAVPCWVRPMSTLATPSHVPARRDPHLVPPPRGKAADGPSDAPLRAYYLEHDAYELLNIGASFFSPEQLNAEHAALVRALEQLRGFCPLPIRSAAVECREATMAVSHMRGLRHLTLSCPPLSRSERAGEPHHMRIAFSLLSPASECGGTSSTKPEGATPPCPLLSGAEQMGAEAAEEALDAVADTEMTEGDAEQPASLAVGIASVPDPPPGLLAEVTAGTGALATTTVYTPVDAALRDVLGDTSGAPLASALSSAESLDGGSSVSAAAPHDDSLQLPPPAPPAAPPPAAMPAAPALQPALPSCCEASLRSLCLSDSQLANPAGLSHVISTLGTLGGALRELDLSDSPIHASGAALLARCAHLGMELSALDLMHACA